MSATNRKALRDLDIPKNVLIYGRVSDGSLIPLETDASGQIRVAVEVGDVIAIVSGPVILLSGEVHVVSGVITTVPSPQGIVVVTASGLATTNSLVYSGTGFLNHETMSIHIENLTNGSGLLYNVRGTVLSGFSPYVLISGSLASGQCIVWTTAFPYSWVDVGLANLQGNYSGTASVYIAKR
jgi:hypothetical protein